MLKFSFLFVLVLVVTATEGRARGSKLGIRRTKQLPFWHHQHRQNPQAGGVPAPVAGPAPVAVPVPVAGPAPVAVPALVTAPQPQSTGYPLPVLPLQSQLTPYPQPQATGYPQPNVAPQPTTYPLTQPTGYPPPILPPQPTAPLIVTPGNVLHPSICQYPGFFPTPGACVNFYRCVDWHNNGAFSIFQFNCPAGTVFDVKIQGCNHIAWAGRPECDFMLHTGVVPVGSGPPPTSVGGPIGYPPPPYPTPQPGGVIPGDGYPAPVGVGPAPVGVAPAPVGVAPAPVGVAPAPVGVAPGPAATASDPNTYFSLQCNLNGKYQRDPLFCNRYYRCQQEGINWNFKTFTCPKDLFFDDVSQQCVDPTMTTQCTGKIAPYTVAEVGTDGAAPAGETEPEPVIPDETGIFGPTETVIETEALPSDFELDPSSQYPCTMEGYFPFELDCDRFYKCSVTTEQTLIGYRYKCPEGYGYSDEKQRCAAMAELPPCDKGPLPASLRGSFPAIELTVSQLRWFFDY